MVEAYLVQIERAYGSRNSDLGLTGKYNYFYLPNRNIAIQLRSNISLNSAETTIQDFGGLSSGRIMDANHSPDLLKDIQRFVDTKQFDKRKAKMIQAERIEIDAQSLEKLLNQRRE